MKNWKWTWLSEIRWLPPQERLWGREALGVVF